MSFFIFSPKKFSENLIIAIGSRVITALIGLIVIGLISRHLGQAGFGSYATILNYLIFFSIFADFGLHFFHVREISRNQEKEEFISSNIFTLRLILLIFISLFSVLISLFLPYAKEIKIGILIATNFITFSSLSQIIGGIFQKYNSFYIISISDVLSRIIQLILVFLAIKKNLGVLAFISITSFISLIHFLIIFQLSKKFLKIILKINWLFIKEVLKKSYPIALSILFSAIYLRIDVLMLSLLKSREDVGIYGISVKVLETILFFPALYTELIMPSLSYSALKLKKDFYEILRKAFNILIIFGVLTVVYLFVLAPKISIIVGGKDFLISYRPTQILSFAIGLIFLGNLGGKALIALDFQKQAMWIYFTGAIFNIIANLIFIPRWSYLGASFVFLLTQILVTSLIFSLIYKKIKEKMDFNIIIKSFSAGLITAFTIYKFRETNILIPLFIGLIVYLFILYIIKGFKNEDLDLRVFFK